MTDRWSFQVPTRLASTMQPQRSLNHENEFTLDMYNSSQQARLQYRDLTCGVRPC